MSTETVSFVERAARTTRSAALWASLLASLPRDDQGWREAGACRGTGPEEFFGDRAQQERAKVRCRVCPVIEVCFWWAVVTEWDGYHVGVFGGAGPRLRSAVSRDLTLRDAKARLEGALIGWRAASGAPMEDRVG